MTEYAPLTPAQISALSAKVDRPGKKAKASITVSGHLLEVIDTLAGPARRSAWIERAIRRYSKQQLQRKRNALELERLNLHADALNAEGDESAMYQASWDEEE